MRPQRIGTVDHVVDQRTAIVVVTRLVQHPKYGKRYRRSTRYLVDARSTADLVAGTVVTIEATRPISRRKRWRVVAEDRGRMTEDGALTSDLRSLSSESPKEMV